MQISQADAGDGLTLRRLTLVPCYFSGVNEAKIPKLFQNNGMWHRHSHIQGLFICTINLTFGDLDDLE